MLSALPRTRLDGLTTTRTGRVVYHRKRHMLSDRDAARVTRRALNFIWYSLPVYEGPGLSKMDAYARFYFRDFCNYASHWNFLPKSMIHEGYEDSPAEDYAFSLATKVAGWLGVPDAALDLAGWIYGEFISGTFQNSFRLDPYFASIIVQSIGLNNQREDEIYGNEK